MNGEAGDSKNLGSLAMEKWCKPEPEKSTAE
jgi:hypothetical protein